MVFYAVLTVLAVAYIYKADDDWDFIFGMAMLFSSMPRVFVAIPADQKIVWAVLSWLTTIFVMGFWIALGVKTLWRRFVPRLRAAWRHRRAT